MATNYERGRAFEYARKKHYEDNGYLVVRSAGSHSPFDLVAFHAWQVPIAIQCKRTKTEGQAKDLKIKFMQNPPISKACGCHQRIEIYVKDTREIVSWTI